MPNTRLKRLLDKKKNASMMPKHKLAEYEEEYLELLSRIESERKKLGIDDESIRKLKEDIESQYGCTNCRKLATKEMIKKITTEEHAIDKAARGGDLDDLKAKSHDCRWYESDKILEVNRPHEETKRK